MEGRNKKSRFFRGILIWLTFAALGGMIYFVLHPTPVHSYQSFEKDIADKLVSRVVIDDEGLLVYPLSGKQEMYRVRLNDTYDAESYMDDKGIPYSFKNPSAFSFLAPLLPYIVFLVVFVLLLYRNGAGGGGKGLFGLRQSKAKIIQSSTKLSDIGGNIEGKQVILDIISFLKDPAPWKSIGARLPKGILLEGPPGTGKTLLARALAGEAKANFYYIAGSDFVELVVGVGSARVRDTFDKAAANAPAILFIDEIDAIGRTRKVSFSSTEEWDNTLNQLLVCMDGLASSEKVIVVGATNRADILDKALLRPGRFDRIVTFHTGNVDDNKAIFEIHSRKKRLATDINADEWSKRFSGITGADIESILNEAALQAVRESNGTGCITNQHIESAFQIFNRRNSELSPLESIILEGSSKLTQANSVMPVSIHLVNSATIEANLKWISPQLVKIECPQSKHEQYISRSQIESMTLRT